MYIFWDNLVEKSIDLANGIFFLLVSSTIISLSLFTCTRDISNPRDNFVLGSHENWVGYYPGGWAIRTRHNNTRENCIFNLQDGVQQNLCFISFLDTSLFAVVLYQLNGFFLHIVRFHIWHLQFPPCWLPCANTGHAHYSRSCRAARRSHG